LLPLHEVDQRITRGNNLLKQPPVVSEVDSHLQVVLLRDLVCVDVDLVLHRTALSVQHVVRRRIPWRLYLDDGHFRLRWQLLRRE
jgi:hypothetical protein